MPDRAVVWPISRVVVGPAGRWLLPADYGCGAAPTSAFTLVSDDAGASWLPGATVPDIPVHGLCPEPAMARVNASTLVAVVRARAVGFYISWSHDGGRTFSAVYFAPTLPDPVVEGSMIFGRYTPPELGVGLPLFFTNPASESAREVRAPITVLNGQQGVGDLMCHTQDITLKMSVDGAAHWSTVRLVQKGCGMYSSVVQFPDGTLGVQWDDAHGGPISHAGLANETFVRLRLAKR